MKLLFVAKTRFDVDTLFVVFCWVLVFFVDDFFVVLILFNWEKL